MSFTVKQPPEELSQEMKDWLTDLQRDIFNAFKVLEPDQLILEKLSVAPDKPSDGEVIYGDGTNFDPGSGVGVYYHNGTSYTKLG